MHKLEVIAKLNAIEFLCENELDNVDREHFEPMILRSPRLGLECLKMWMSKYYVSLKTKALIDEFEANPTWDNFHVASHFLMLDRIVAAVALDGNVTSCVKECIDLTLKCGNIDVTTLTWVQYYCGVNEQQMAV